ncbi:putative 6-phosphofructokinase [Streptomyces sp. Tu6071]|nr:putative 6-phosphofructokinase [Streptomyces sp. Tu6071]
MQEVAAGQLALPDTRREDEGVIGPVRLPDLLHVPEVLEDAEHPAQDRGGDRPALVRLVDDRTGEHDVLGEQGLDGVHVTGLDGRTEGAHGISSSPGRGSSGATLVPGRAARPRAAGPIRAATSRRATAGTPRPATTARPRRPSAGPRVTGLEDRLRLFHPLPRHRLQRRHRLRERDHHDVRAAQCRHVAEVAAVGGLDGVPAEARGEDAVVGGGGAAALDVAEDDRAGLLAEARFEFVGERGADAAEALVAELVDLALAVVHRPGRRVRALGDADDGELLAAREAFLDHLHEVGRVEGPLGQADAVRAARHARLQGDPARVPPHDLDDHDPLVGLGRGLEAVDRLGRDADGGVEAEGAVGRGDVVVDRLRHADDRHPALGEHPRGGQGALAADRDEDVDAEFAGEFGRVGAGFGEPPALQTGRAEDRAAAGEDAAHRVEVEFAVVPVEQALVPVLEPDHLVTVVRDGAVHDRPDHCVEARTVAACGENSDAHRAVLLLAY